MKNNIVALVAIVVVVVVGGYMWIQKNESDVPKIPFSSESKKSLFDIDYRDALLTIDDVGDNFWTEKDGRAAEPRFTDEAVVYEQGFLRKGNLFNGSNGENPPVLISQTITLPIIFNKIEPILAQKIETATHGDQYYLESKETMDVSGIGSITIYRIKNDSAAGKFITYTAFTEITRFEGSIGGSIIEIMVIDINKYKDEFLIELVRKVKGKISSTLN